MGTWFDQSLARAEQVNDWLSPQRLVSLERLRQTPWPTTKTEAWKYTPLRVLDTLELNPAATTSAQQNDVKPETIAGFDCIDITFADGQLQPQWQNGSFPAGLRVTALDKDSRESVEPLFGRVKSPRHFFGLINDTLATQGIVIEVDDGAEIDTPIRINHLLREGAETHTRTLVKVGKNAKVSIVEHFSGDQTSVNTNFAEFSLEPGSQLEHGRFVLQGGQAINIGGCHFRLESKAQLSSNIVGLGSDLSRLDVDIVHVGEQAHARLQAIYLLDDRELFDLHTNVEHRVANCVTTETVRGIAGGEARAVFNGRIHIHPHAQKTLAELNNRNLLLSDRAEINTKPELEIYADDVRCAHGATVAQMDEKALYYLRTRGVDSTQAQVMLNFAFINELINEVENAALADWLRSCVQQRFAAMCE